MKSRKIYILYGLQCFFIGMLVLVLLGYRMQARRNGFFENELFSENVRGLQMSSGEYMESVDFHVPELDEPFMLYRYLSSGQEESVRGAYGTRDVFGFSEFLESGHFFSAEEFESESPVSVVGAKACERCEERDGKRFYVYNNTEYEVIGVFGRRDNLLDKAVFLNLRALDSTMDQYCGVYYVDAQDPAVIDRVVNRIREDAAGKWTIFDKEHETPGSVIMGRMEFTLFVFSSISAVLCLLITTIFLISGQRYSIAVKKLVGMTKREMFRENLRHMLTICTGAFGAITGTLWLLVHVGKVPFFVSSGVGIIHFAVMGGILLVLGVFNALYTTRLACAVDLSMVLKGR